MTKKTTHLLIVLDGWGHREPGDDNAISLANTPNWDRLWREQPHGLISGSGVDVGLPDGQMGNSEVGHMNLGAGRVVDQEFSRISKAVADDTFKDNDVLKDLFKPLATSGNALHIFGLLSPGGVHSHENHVKAAVTMARDNGVKTIWVHAFLDGRDVPPKSAKPSIVSMQEHLVSGGAGGIASIVGRYYAMDRDNRWERVEPAYDLVTQGIAEYSADTPIAGLESAYARGESDEFVMPTTCQPEPVAMADGDAVLFMNFRADRARELSRAFVHDDFNDFERKARPSLSGFTTLTEYAEDIHAPCAYSPMSLEMGLGEYISSLDKTQLRIAETEKYAHVTFFFSGGRESPFKGEQRLLVPSPSVATYDLQPEMSAPEVTGKIVDAINDGDYDLIVCNFANGDMVGHTGNLQASIKAVECLDACIGRIEAAILENNGHCLITADHGNVEKMSDHQTGQAHTAHTSEPVPLVYVGKLAIQLQSGGALSDVAPTLLDIMGEPIPAQMTGRSLLTPETSRVAAGP